MCVFFCAQFAHTLSYSPIKTRAIFPPNKQARAEMSDEVNPPSFLSGGSPSSCSSSSSSSSCCCCCAAPGLRDPGVDGGVAAEEVSQHGRPGLGRAGVEDRVAVPPPHRLVEATRRRPRQRQIPASATAAAAATASVATNNTCCSSRCLERRVDVDGEDLRPEVRVVARVVARAQVVWCRKA
jgi:hypothetical protein